ncbi:MULTISPECIES: hypothetical protein [Pantoea]|uniref:hypothetical protein n=1 Tax=Pantoea TaxID=53335 RepID=UPI001F349535|nr:MULTISPECIES: hypothetical protein [Pantoea]UIL50604.1 hypothetical protein LZU96_09980 [Pantoea agglomerans]
MKYLFVLLIVFINAGCAAKKTDAVSAAWQASMPSCSAHSSEIDCQWNNVPDRDG